MLNKIVQYYIIAEIGINHDGVKSKAIKLIELAEKSGVDAIKFQTFKADTKMIEFSDMIELFIKKKKMEKLVFHFIGRIIKRTDK